MNTDENIQTPEALDERNDLERRRFELEKAKEAFQQRLERERLDLEKAREGFQQRLEQEQLDLEQMKADLEKDKLGIERERLQIDKRLLNKHLGTIITAIVAFAAVAVSVGQVAVTMVSKEKELEVQQKQHSNDFELQTKKQEQEWNLSTARFFIEHQKEVFGGSASERSRILRVLVLTFPETVIDAISARDPQIAASILRTKKALQDNPDALIYERPGVGRVPYQVKNGRIEYLDNWEARNIQVVEIPQLRGKLGAPTDGRIPFNRAAAEHLRAAFADIEKEGLTPLILSWDGGYEPDSTQIKSGVLTSHALGLAFNINKKWNPSSKPAAEGSEGSVRKLIPIFVIHRFRWGGEKDPSHFYYPQAAVSAP